MAGGNGDYDWRQEMAKRMEAMEKAHKELEDSFIVMTHLETRMSQFLREQAEYIAGHEARLREHEARLREQEQRDRILDERIEKLVSAIGEMTRHLPPRADL